ncbi:hypothetical protein BCR42DRAFT_394829 [Absidia repens]|uniref:Galactose oxidase n=1 Tax=Absidia repens TaxID=90262 RepID=A0A1X2I9V5_9FUNG|nr:hypothetical protein BCR42DRAFT_394829 [Absidia repens]
MMYPFGLSIIVLIYLICLVKADSLPPIYKHGCVVLRNQKLYCHGGAFRSNSTTDATQTLFTDDKLYDHHVYLDVSRPLNISSANTQWQPVAPSPTSPFTLEPRADFAITAINESSYVVSGGIGPSPRVTDNQVLANITVFYNSQSNKWSVLKPLEGEKVLNYTLDMQLFGQRATQMNDTEYFIFGGIPPDNNTIVTPNTTYVDLISSDVGWSTNVTAWALAVTRGGELFPDLCQPWVSILSFNFGGLLSSPSAPVVPKLSKLILYGGVDGKGIIHDFCWWYKPTEKKWEIAKFTNGDGPGRRFGHQAVLIGSEMLYIIGGIDAAGVTQSDVHILNVTSMTWLNGSYTNTYDQMKDTESNGGGSDGSQGESLGGGAIAGIVIGCVAGVGILVAAAVIMRVQSKKKALLKSGSAPDGFTTAPVPPITEHNMNSAVPPGPAKPHS